MGAHAHLRLADVAQFLPTALLHVGRQIQGYQIFPVFKIGQKVGLLCERSWLLTLLSAHQGDLKCLLDQREHTQGWNLACGPPVACRFSLVGKGLCYGWAIPRNPCIDPELYSSVKQVCQMEGHLAMSRDTFGCQNWWWCW